MVIRAGASAQFSPQVVALTGGGSVNVVNLDTIDHTFTSQAVDAAGRPLFDVRIPSGSTVTVPATALLADGSYGFFCTFHPHMRGTLVVSGSDGTVDPQLPDSSSRWWSRRWCAASGSGSRCARPAYACCRAVVVRRMWTYGGRGPVRPSSGRPARTRG